jgi:hypothetical protein
VTDSSPASFAMRELDADSAHCDSESELVFRWRKNADCDVDEKHNAGAKAQQLLCFTCGTTVVVPCYKAGS